MTARQVMAYARYRRALHAKRSCCGGLCTTSREALASQPKCHCGCCRKCTEHNEMKAAA